MSILARKGTPSVTVNDGCNFVIECIGDALCEVPCVYFFKLTDCQDGSVVEITMRRDLDFDAGHAVEFNGHAYHQLNGSMRPARTTTYAKLHSLIDTIEHIVKEDKKC